MEIMNIMNATNATGMASGNQETGDIMATIKDMSIRFAENVVMNLAAREMAELMRSCGASAVNSEASVVPPASPSSAVVNTPTAELSPTASVSEVQSPTLPAAAQFETATISPTIPNAPEPQPSPTVGEQTALTAYVNPPVAPDLHERPAASYSSPEVSVKSYGMLKKGKRNPKFHVPMEVPNAAAKKNHNTGENGIPWKSFRLNSRAASSSS